jgi:glycosyltransferase involved in cell wall biosynthesis
VVVPAFNAEATVGACLEALGSQSVPGELYEVIVVDDGSTDGTGAVVARFPVKAVRQDNRGPAAARNRGIAAARGELLAFLDADDLWLAEKLERQQQLLAKRPEVGLCCTHAQNFWIEDLRAEAEALREHRVSRPLPALLASTMLVRREIFAQVGYFDEELGFGHSTEWFLRAQRRGVGAATLPDVLYLRRIHQTNRSRVLGAESRDEFLNLIKRHLDEQRAVVAPQGSGRKRS